MEKEKSDLQEIKKEKFPLIVILLAIIGILFGLAVYSASRAKHDPIKVLPDNSNIAVAASEPNNNGKNLKKHPQQSSWCHEKEAVNSCVIPSSYALSNNPQMANEFYQFVQSHPSKVEIERFLSIRDKRNIIPTLVNYELYNAIVLQREFTIDQAITAVFLLDSKINLMNAQSQNQNKVEKNTESVAQVNEEVADFGIDAETLNTQHQPVTTENTGAPLSILRMKKASEPQSN